jgi:hypothetical protein
MVLFYGNRDSASITELTVALPDTEGDCSF